VEHIAGNARKKRTGKMSKYLVTDKNGQQVLQGFTVADFRGNLATFDSVTRGTEYNGTAKVRVMFGTLTDPTFGEFYAQVFGLTVQTVEGN
jgi:hypothetical protein